MRFLKFGGSSLAHAKNIEKVVKIILASTKSSDCAVVLSAMQGVTDLLVAAGRLAENRDGSFRMKITQTEEKHVEAVRKLIPITKQSSVLSFIKDRINDLENICESVFLLKELSPRTLDLISSFGEILLSHVVAAKLDSLGVENTLIDSGKLIKTDSNHGLASVDFQKTNKNISSFFEKSDSTLFLIPGFIASDESDKPTTLGRGGSDYTAAIFASALNADALEIWTNVGGIMSADPAIVRRAKVISHITYKEAMELSHFGAKVIYPPTIQPLMVKNIPVHVKNTFSPDEKGTLIGAKSKTGGNIVRGITSIDKICLLSLEGGGMVGIPGFSKRLFGALSRAKINVVLITQSSSEHSICAAVIEESGQLAKQVVDKEFHHEIISGAIEPLKIEAGLSCLALVGDNMKSHTGIAGKMFSTLGNNGINVHAIAQGSSERNISAIIASKDVHKAVNSLHETFFSVGKKQINLFIIGVGKVGQKLLEQINRQQKYLAENMNLSLRVVGLANSKKVVFSEEGIDLKNWKERLEASQHDLTHINTSDEIAHLMMHDNLRNSILVDVTASETVSRVYPLILSKSISIVACNKFAASSKFENYQVLKNLAKEYNANFLFETNVGAGLPIISTLNDIVQSGDKINRIDAVLSGTLNFVFNNYDTSQTFADVVRRAQEEGYTEPDPRFDLSGLDVARKILILARESGCNMEISDVENCGFLPENCFRGNVSKFYKELERHERYFADLYNKTASKGLKLKYIASFSKGAASVRLEAVDESHNFSNLSGKDNSVLFYTNRYDDFPLVIKGAGAGADVTAAGVFADIIRASRN